MHLKYTSVVSKHVCLFLPVPDFVMRKVMFFCVIIIMKQFTNTAVVNSGRSEVSNIEGLFWSHGLLIGH